MQIAQPFLAHLARVYFHLGIFDSPLVERTGAGDSFAVGFLAGLIQTDDVQKGLIWGTLNSASVVSKVGPQPGLLTKKEMMNFIKKNLSYVIN